MTVLRILQRYLDKQGHLEVLEDGFCRYYHIIIASIWMEASFHTLLFIAEEGTKPYRPTVAPSSDPTSHLQQITKISPSHILRPYLVPLHLPIRLNHIPMTWDDPIPFRVIDRDQLLLDQPDHPINLLHQPPLAFERPYRARLTAYPSRRRQPSVRALLHRDSYFSLLRTA